MCPSGPNVILIFWCPFTLRYSVDNSIRKQYRIRKYLSTTCNLAGRTKSTRRELKIESRWLSRATGIHYSAIRLQTFKEALMSLMVHIVLQYFNRSPSEISSLRSLPLLPFPLSFFMLRICISLQRLDYDTNYI